MYHGEQDIEFKTLLQAPFTVPLVHLLVATTLNLQEFVESPHRDVMYRTCSSVLEFARSCSCRDHQLILVHSVAIVPLRNYGHGVTVFCLEIVMKHVGTVSSGV